MSEKELIETRQQKHQQLNNGAYSLPTYINHYYISELISIIDQLSFTQSLLTSISLPDFTHQPVYYLHGRLKTIRKSGAITFLNLVDQTGNIQLIASKNNLSTYSQLPLLDLGDIVEISGYPCLSKSGEKSILIIDWKLLTKAHRPPPDKYLGLNDPEIKYRKRYLDLISSEESRARFFTRSAILRVLRRFMEQEGFLEVETSTLNSISSGANAKPFTTHHNALDMDLFLRIAPELYLKRLVVGGFEKVYEIGRAYRNEGIDTKHNPEFTMMECYQAYTNFDDLLAFSQRLLTNMDLYLKVELEDTIAEKYYDEWTTNRSFTLNQYKVVSMADAVRDSLFLMGYAPACDWGSVMSMAHLPFDQHRYDRVDWLNLKKRLANCSSNGERLATMFEFVAEPFLIENYRTEDGKFSLPVFITDYPIEVCPLARKNDLDGSVCDRFELFVDGRELANAFQELNDPAEQTKRLQEQLTSKSSDPMDFDADYIEALEMGMPPCAGFGIGICRLVMALTGTNTIRDVILFPTLRGTNE